jgi:signal transduction histidine kinase
VCFRVVQEALTNVARHAQAQQVYVGLQHHERELKLAIRDDGVGFDVTTAHKRAMLGMNCGLLGMQERVHLIGGQIKIKSKLNHGTTICARFPLTSPISPEKRNKKGNS